MKKTNIERFSEEFQLGTVNLMRLGNFWDRLLLGGDYWRLYHNDAAGAGVVIDGRHEELRPDEVYLLAPCPNLVTFCNGKPEQLYIHFNIGRLYGNRERVLTRLPLTGSLAEQLADLRERLRDGTDPNRINLLAMSAATLAATQLPSEALATEAPDRRIAIICRLMQDESWREFPVSELAHRAGMASNSFIRKFREVTGSTPHQYLVSLRYTQAARLLENTDLAIKDICESVGIADRFLFTRCFRRIYGVPPARYRANLAK
ncbi:MAG: AraC family transcriptional regulator [Victivallaceae bacterium]|nr:AraC family transcriptional regulator [Victivallaceae bacterium]